MATVFRYTFILAVVTLAQPGVATGQGGLSSTPAALVAQAKEQPDTVREALSRELNAMTSARSNGQRTAHLIRARRLADAYARAWDDSFFVRQVTRFELSSPVQRLERVASDSLRRAGNAAMGEAGVPAAMKLWRESLRRARSIGDSAVIAPALLSVGAGFYRLAQFDSAAIYLKRAEGLAVRIGDRRTAGNAIGILASVAKDQGELDVAVALYRRAAAARARSGDTRGIAADENNIGLIAQQRGNLREATLSFERALQLNRSGKRTALVALNLANLAAIAANMAEYGRAEALYREALALHRSGGDRAETAFALHGLGKLYMSRGDYRQAAATLGEALRVHDSSGAVMEALAVRADMAAVENAMGDPEAARVLLEQAARSANAARAPPEAQATLALARADLALQFGTFADAETGYSQAVRLYRIAGDSSGLARGLEGKALLLHWRGDDAASLTLLREAMRMQIARGDRRSAALTALILADVQMAGGDTAMSRRTLIAAHRSLRGIGDAVGEASALAALGDLLRHRGSFLDANAAYRAGLKRLGSREASELRWRLHTGLADALRSSGSLAAAAAQFRIAIAAAENVAARVLLEERRSGFLADKWSAYKQLALVELARGRPAEAFAVSEQMRARQMLDLLARGRVGSATTATREEQDLRRRIAVLTERLETGQLNEPRLREPPIPVRAGEATRRELDVAHKAYARLLVHLRESDPTYAALVSAKTRSWKELASRLNPDQVFLEYLLTDSTCTVFVVTSDTVAAIDLQMTRQSLADLVEFSRNTIDSPDRLKAQELWRVPLRRLYTVLVQPVADGGYLRGKRRLLIAPHGELHFLSFAALIARGKSDRFLVEQFDIGYTPSATVWVELGERRFRPQPAGVLALAPDERRLPGSRREAIAIGRIYGKSARVRMGAAATPDALRAALPDVGIVHLATFGVLNKHNPLFSFIELAPARQDDGRLEVNEVFGLKLSGQLVILSACQTGLASGALADVPPGDDWVGLVQAFLQAGARSVVATLWPVEDRATGALMEQFHERLVAGIAPATALAEAQRSLIRNSATARPLYWAGFSVSGRSD
ncbi:MAG: CHAT domain-containing protein [Gemmatimonadaceae bacterium]